MGLNDLSVQLVENLLLVLRVLAECEDQVLGRDAARLGASEEESQDFIDDANLAIFEVILNK